MVRANKGIKSQPRFHVHIGKSKSRCRTLLNGVLQGSVDAPTLSNLFTYNVSTTVSRKYIYADGIAMTASDKCFRAVEQTLSDNLDKLKYYFYKWRIKLNTTKDVCSAFHQTNHLSDYELGITNIGQGIPFNKTRKYLGVIFDCTLSYNQHLLQTAKVRKRCILRKKLANKHCGVNFTTFCTSTLALCFSVASTYCCSIRSQCHHCKKISTSLNDIGYWLHQIHSYRTTADLSIHLSINLSIYLSIPIYIYIYTYIYTYLYTYIYYYTYTNFVCLF